jgi:hypothetical protein
MGAGGRARSAHLRRRARAAAAAAIGGSSSRVVRLSDCGGNLGRSPARHTELCRSNFEPPRAAAKDNCGLAGRPKVRRRRPPKLVATTPADEN